MIAAGDVPARIVAAGPKAVAAWQDFLVAGHYAPSTRYIYGTIGRRFLDWLDQDGIDLECATSSAVQQFLDHQNVSESSRHHYRGILRHFFDVLIAGGVVPVNPAAVVVSALTISLAEQFTRFSAIERQATVDAAAFALAMHDIYLFTDGAGGQKANVDACIEALRLGDQYGILPFDRMEPSQPAIEADTAE